MLDADGYPTDETLQKVAEWDPMDFDGLLDLFKSIWYAPSYIKVDGDVAHVSTAGWSGNEDLLGALSPGWKALHFWSLRRGGHYVFIRYGKGCGKHGCDRAADVSGYCEDHWSPRLDRDTTTTPEKGE